MPLEPSALELFCQNCGASWPRSDSASYFYLSSASISSGASPSEVSALGEDILFCPKCPLSLDSALRSGDDRTSDL